MNCAKCDRSLGDLKKTVVSISVEVMGDEYIYSYWKCEGCGWYTREMYHDRFCGPESSSITAVPPLDGERDVLIIQKCPDPADKRCTCETHRKFGYG